MSTWEFRYNVIVGDLWVIPILVGLAAWYVSTILTGILPFFPPFQSICMNPECRSHLTWNDAILLKKCPKCGKAPPIRIWISLVIILFLSLYSWVLSPKEIGYFGGMVVFTYLFVVAVIDFEHHLILRPLSIAGVIIGALTGYFMQGWKSMLIGGIAGFSILGIFYLFGKLFIRFRNRKQGTTEAGEDALGSGDITLAIVLGLMVGWPLIWFNILIGVLLAGLISLFIIIWLVITKRYPKNAFMVFIPLGPGFIFVTMMILFFPHYVSLILPK